MSGGRPSYRRLETLSSLYDGYRKVFRVSGTELLLLQTAGRHILIENRCPHQGYPLHRATCEGDTLRCPKHGLTFDLGSGACITQGASCGGLIHHQPVYEGNGIGVLSNLIEQQGA